MDPSPRKQELLDRAYEYVLEHGLIDLSLRPLARAIGSSPRVLLYLFGSREGLISALLAKARSHEQRLLQADPAADLGAATGQTWQWLAAPEHRALLTLWLQAYAQSLVDPVGPWAGFARATVDDWLTVLARSQPPARRRTRAGRAERGLALAVLRGNLLDLLATGETERCSAAVRQFTAAIRNELATGRA